MIKNEFSKIFNNKSDKNKLKIEKREFKNNLRAKKREFRKLSKKYITQKPLKNAEKFLKLEKDIVIKLENARKIIPLNNKMLEIIKGINLEIKSKDFVILFGESGSGKTTLLGLMSALERPSEGSVNVLGNLTASLNDSKLTLVRSKYIGYIFQQYGLLDSISVIDNTMVSTNKKNIENAKKILKILGLGKLMYKNVTDLSGGQQQRVSIARALAKNPKIIFADEPTGAVDSKTAKDIIKIFRRLNNQGKTIIMVTHNKNLAKIGNRIINLVDGKIQSDIKNQPINIDNIIWH